MRPVSAQAVMTDRDTRRAAARLQRQLTLRVIRGYRTISYEASLLLARVVSFELVVDRLRRHYLRRRVFIERDGSIAPRVMNHIRDEEIRRSIVRWRRRLEELSRNTPEATV